jgi:adenine-specific DNA-methyltransferase
VEQERAEKEINEIGGFNMAAIKDLLRQIADPKLRERLTEEVERISKNKKFGLVFEEHIPECTPLYGVPVRRGLTVARKTGKVNEVFKVKKIDGENAVCIGKTTGEAVTIPLAELVTVALFGEPIFPSLEPIDKVTNAPDDSLWHTIIEADNYHALQLLEYLYEGQVDCIYIDPPYNTGARDWKYNNDYVDGKDAFRHSKWLSMMQKRLKLAKRILNPDNSVLIVTIDEKEYLHLGLLLTELFPEAKIQMISSVINPAGSTRTGGFSRTDEYIYFVMLGSAKPIAIPLIDEWRGKIKGGYKDKLRWNGLQRSGTSVLRQDRPNMFYPIYVNENGTKIVSVGDSISLETDRKIVLPPDGCVAVWPIFPDGREGRWRLGKDTLVALMPKHYVKLGRFRGEQTSITYLAKGEQAKVEAGDFPIIGYADDESIIVDESGYEAKFVPGTQWWISSHDATQNGTKILTAIVPNVKFAFPKSPYAVRDALRFYVANNPNALIVDFFAGSGTTLHAVNMLNVEDSGGRRCILVTNNEVSAEEAQSAWVNGYQPGDPEWEAHGICRSVTWPRTEYSILGKRTDGSTLTSEYTMSDGIKRPMSEGFPANVEYFKLGFLDKNNVSLGQQFTEILPLLWLKAGAVSERPELDGEELPEMLILPQNAFAILLDEDCYSKFAEVLLETEGIKTVYFVTNSEEAFREMSDGIGIEQTYQLYRDYIDNFVLGARRNLI